MLHLSQVYPEDVAALSLAFSIIMEVENKASGDGKKEAIKYLEA